MNLLIKGECETEGCNHTIQFVGDGETPDIYKSTCGGCGTELVVTAAPAAPAAARSSRTAEKTAA